MWYNRLHEVLFSHKHECIFRKTAGTGDHYVKQSKPSRKQGITFFSPMCMGEAGDEDHESKGICGFQGPLHSLIY